jgi:hypothetical protein
MRNVVVAALLLCPLAACSPQRVPDLSMTTPLPSLPVLTEAEAEGLQSLPWTAFAPTSSPPVAQAGAGFAVSVPAADCPPHIRGVTVARTATSVVVAVMGEPRPPASCAPSAARSAVAFVRLPDWAAGYVIEHAPEGP